MLKQLKGSIILLITAIVWGSSFVAQSEGMKLIEPFTYNSIRTLIGGIVLVPVIFCFQKFGKRAPVDWKNSILGGVFCGIVLSIASSFQQFGIVTTTAGKSGFVTAMYVVFVPLLALFLGQKQRPIIWICVFTAIVGFYFLCFDSDFTIVIGDWLTLICAVFFAVQILTVDSFLKRGADGVVMACTQFFTAGLIMLILMFIFEKPSVGAIFEAKYTILYAGVLSCGVGYTLQIIGQRYTAPTVATLIMSLESVFSVLSGWIVLGEALDLRQTFGCVLVFSAVILAQVRFPLKKKQ